MKLDILVNGVAALLGPPWRFEYRGSAPVIVHQIKPYVSNMLVFDDTDPRKLVVRLMIHDGDVFWAEAPYTVGIHEVAARIERQIFTKVRDKHEDERERLGWCNTWSANFIAWAAAQGLSVEFATEVEGTRILNLRAEFFSQRRSHVWGAITVSYDSFPAKVEYFTTEEAILARIDAVVQRITPSAIQPPPQLPHRKRSIRPARHKRAA